MFLVLEYSDTENDESLAWQLTLPNSSKLDTKTILCDPKCLHKCLM